VDLGLLGSALPPHAALQLYAYVGQATVMLRAFGSFPASEDYPAPLWGSLQVGPTAR
jgi:hypothetical protein